jgi:hypothetical protein
MDENTTVLSFRSGSTSETVKNMVSPDRKPVLPKLKDNDSLIVQLEVRLNGICTNNMIENLTEMVLTLSEETGQFLKITKF